jgi:ATP-dependent protease HslVU (ClpYQ) ATPase subunit
MSQVSLDALEMKDFLNHIIDNNRYIQGQGKTPVSTEVIGDSGLGKTSIVLQVAEEHNLNFVKLNLAQIEEVGDLVGYPVRQFQMSKGETQPTTKLVKDPNTGKVTKVTSLSGTAQAEWIDENAVDQYAKQGYTFYRTKENVLLST